MIQELRREHSLTILLEIAHLPKATYYYHRKNQDKQDKYAQAKAEITAILHENKGRYGYRRVTDELRNRGFSLNHKTVQWLMKKLGLVCRVRMKKYRSYKGEQGKVADNELNREFCAERPNQKRFATAFGSRLALPAQAIQKDVGRKMCQTEHEPKG